MTPLQNLSEFIEEHSGAAVLSSEELTTFLGLVTNYLDSTGRKAEVFINGEIDPAAAFNALIIAQESLIQEDSKEIEPIKRALEEAGAYFVKQYVDGLVSGIPTTTKELAPIRPNNLTMPNTLLAQSLQEITNKGDVTLETGSRLRKKKPKRPREPITETANASFVRIGSNGAEIEGNYTEFHEAVFCSFLSLWLAGNRAITANMIQRFLTQNFTGGIKKKSLEEIDQALEDLQIMKVKVDITEEARRRNWTDVDIDRFRYGERMLYLSEFEVSSGGKTERAWTLYNPYRMPLLYDHALLSGQFINVPSRLLKVKDPDSGKAYRSTKAREQIEFYLLRQIKNIQRSHHNAKTALDKWNKKHKAEEQRTLADYTPMSQVISYETVFEKTGLSDKSYKQKADYEAYIKACLKYWKKEGELKGFEAVHNGKRKDVETGVKILLSEK